jgi:hypothetical protein
MKKKAKTHSANIWTGVYTVKVSFESKEDKEALLDYLNKDLETVSKKADYYRTMYLKYKELYDDLVAVSKMCDSILKLWLTIANIKKPLFLETGVEEGIAKAKVEKEINEKES